MSALLLDCSLRLDLGCGFSDYRYGGTFWVDGRNVRVRLCRDIDCNVSFAVAEVLENGFRWRRLLDAEPPSVSRAANAAGELEEFARQLSQQARNAVRTGEAE